MEHQPSHNPQERELNSHEHEHPELAGIDLTRAVPRDGNSREAASQALITAISLASHLNIWGAKIVARALAERQREILTGQNELLSNVINSAILEAFVITGEFPEWGARALGRELADRSDNPDAGALHHYAATGRIDKEAMLAELENIRDNAHDKEVFAWAVLLGNYIDPPSDTSNITDTNE